MKTAQQTKNNSRSRGIVRVSGEYIPVLKNSLPVADSKGITDWRSVLAMFVASQDIKQSSRDLYTRTLSRFFVWIEETNRVLNTLTREDILEYKDYLLSSGMSALTVGSYIVVVRKFYDWTESLKIYPNIARGVKTPKRKQAFKKQHLTEDKSKELLDYYRTKSLRDFAIVNLMIRTGLRTIEVTRLNLADITFKGNQRVLLVWGKGHEEREDFVVLTDKAYLPIREYLNTRKGAKSGDPLFVSNSRQNKGERLTTRTVSQICKEGLDSIGLEGKEFTAHSLRHTTACLLLRNGGTLRDTQLLLRHNSPETTQIYVESLKEEETLGVSANILDSVL